MLTTRPPKQLRGVLSPFYLSKVALNSTMTNFFSMFIPEQTEQHISKYPLIFRFINFPNSICYGFLLLFALAMQPSAGYGLLVHEVS
jgi:hypothetical protein